MDADDVFLRGFGDVWHDVGRVARFHRGARRGRYALRDADGGRGRFEAVFYRLDGDSGVQRHGDHPGFQPRLDRVQLLGQRLVDVLRARLRGRGLRLQPPGRGPGGQAEGAGAHVERRADPAQFRRQLGVELARDQVAGVLDGAAAQGRDDRAVRHGCRVGEDPVRLVRRRRQDVFQRREQYVPEVGPQRLFHALVIVRAQALGRQKTH